MATGVAITSKVNALLDAARTQLGLPKEALAHAIFVLALTDPTFLARAAELSRFLDNKGSEALEGMGL